MTIKAGARLFNSVQLGFLGGVIAPLALLVFILKIWRILSRSGLNEWLLSMQLIRSDLLVIIAFAAFGLVLLGAGSKSSRRYLLVLLQIIAAIWAIIEVISHQFYMATGSTLDLHLLVFSINRLGETFLVVSSEIPAAISILLAETLLVIILLPARLISKIPDISGRNLIGYKSLVAMGGLGLISTSMAVVPVSSEDYPAFGLSSVVNMVVSLNDARDIDIVEVKRESLAELEIAPKSEQSQAGSVQKKNLVMVILESTRAKSTTIHDPQLNTTPFLASLAEKSIVAERAYAVVPHTSKALVAMLCGIEPQLTMPINEARPGGIPSRCMAELLADVGYQSVFLQSATKWFENREQLVSNMGYGEFISLEKMESDGFEKANYFGPEDAVMLAPSEEWLKKQSGKEPFFATYLTLTPHHNYLAPSKRYGRHKFAEGEELNRYQNAVHYVDQFSRQLVEQYKELGLYENTVFVFIGDHGEAFYEHGRNQHDNIMWEEGLHVPLIIFDPSQPEARRISHPVSQLDILPTLLDIMGYQLQGAEIPGQLMWNENPGRTLYAHCWYERQCMAAITDRFKLIDHFGQKRLELYDLEEDPNETLNLAKQHNGEELLIQRAELYGWREAVNTMYSDAHLQPRAKSVLASQFDAY